MAIIEQPPRQLELAPAGVAAPRQKVEARRGLARFIQRDESQRGAVVGLRAPALRPPRQSPFEGLGRIGVDHCDAGLIRIAGAEEVDLRGQ